jgi:hypothetical protein
VVAFDSDPRRVREALEEASSNNRGCTVPVRFGDGANPELVRQSGVSEPRAIFLTYAEHSQCLAAAARLRAGFEPHTPIYARAQTRLQAQELKKAGATEVVVEFDELPRSAPAMIFGRGPPWPSDLEGAELAKMVELYESMDADASGMVSFDELRTTLAKSNTRLSSDCEISKLDTWLIDAQTASEERLSFYDFCRLWRDIETIRDP